MPVSIVVAARNELHNLPELIDSLVQQDYKDFEIVIVNDRSEDGSFDLLQNLKNEYVQLRVVNIDHKPEKIDGKKYALTLGIKAAKHEIIILTDADCRPAGKKWISIMTEPFNNSNIMINLGVSLQSSDKGVLGSFISFETLWTAIQYLGFALLGRPYMGVGRNLAYRKSFFLKNKGFHGFMELTGGDDDLFVNKYSKRSNTAVTIGKESLTITKAKNSWQAFFIQKTRHLSVGKYYKLVDKLLLSVFPLSLTLYWLLLFYFIYNTQWHLVTILFLCRTLFLYITFILGCKKIGAPFKLWGLLFLDFIYVFYYLSTGVRALFTKRVRWS